MISLLLRIRMRNISPEMLIFLPVLCFLPLTGAAPSLTTEQLDMGVAQDICVYVDHTTKLPRPAPELCKAKDLSMASTKATLELLNPREF
ncbi:hypothetical protein ATANTOWER_009525 [Ataeniobius toweri]|uniref:Uncharacterized protein n=1 Tax=Ataeniobius toweri TaxID=208326 RepID=A0ABU7B7Y1_9TELE|nr:hypothetical protein [Ataeniobius toweri]